MRTPLSELREKWEKGMEVRLAVSSDETVLVLLEKEDRFHLYRYFPVDGWYSGIYSKNWEVSIDYDGRDFNHALKHITDWFSSSIQQLMQT